MAKHKIMEFSNSMVFVMKAFLRMICNMDLVLKGFQMEAKMLDTIKMVKNMESLNICLLTDLRTKAHGKKIKYQELVNIFGLTGGNTPDNGKVIICMDLELISGQMDDHIVEIMLMIRKMVLGNTNGPMEEFIEANGVTVNSMAMEYMSIMMEIREEVFGSKAKGLSGLID